MAADNLQGEGPGFLNHIWQIQAIFGAILLGVICWLAVLSLAFGLSSTF